MNSKKTLTLFSLLLFLSFSCKDEKKTEMKASTIQMKEVMAIHDQIMPEMGKFGPLVGELSSKEDSTEIGLKYKSAREDLQAAHNSMMKWMQDFGNKFDSDEILNGKELSEQKQKWLAEEQEKIKNLEEEINRSVENAKALLNK
jgi:hypothetical protein